MIGSLVFPEHSRIGNEIFEDTKKSICPPFKRDLLRLCEQLPYYPNFVETTNQSLLNVVEFLQSSDKVKKVFWAYQKDSAQFFESRAGTDKPGCVVSFELNGEFETFYNRLQMLKSPSFGTEFSICCPYIYLAHYDKLSTKAGRQELENADLRPELCRLSVGLEDPDEIKSAISEGLNTT